MSRKLKDFIYCVYIIRFTNYPKVYVGSSTRWPYRKREHLKDLKDNKHCNKYLQRAVNKYGLENVLIEELEICTDKNAQTLRNLEQKWVNHFDSSNSAFGFNLVKDVIKLGTVGFKMTQKSKDKLSISNIERFKSKESREKVSEQIQNQLNLNPNIFGGKFVPKTYTLFSPVGQEVSITNFCKFCREYDLDYSVMYKVWQGEIVEHKGWKKNLDRINQVKKSFVFLSPDGVRVEILGLRSFCVENNLAYRTMLNIHNNIGVWCQGWRKFREDGLYPVHKGKNFSLQTPSGDIIEINNIKNFCKENSICYETLRKGLTSKGWKIAAS